MLGLAAAHRHELTVQPNTTPAATALFRDRESDIALGMAQRLGKKSRNRCGGAKQRTARRFRRQVFVSVDIGNGGQRLGLEAEKGVLRALL